MLTFHVSEDFKHPGKWMVVESSGKVAVDNTQKEIAEMLCGMFSQMESNAASKDNSETSYTSTYLS